jgi:hypothetical protein
VAAGAAASDQSLELIHQLDECSHSIPRQRRRSEVGRAGLEPATNNYHRPDGGLNGQTPYDDYARKPRPGRNR